MQNINDYPMVLKASDIAEILRVSEPKAYAMMEEPSFPLIRSGRTKRVLRDNFMEWLVNET